MDVHGSLIVRTSVAPKRRLQQFKYPNDAFEFSSKAIFLENEGKRTVYIFLKGALERRKERVGSRLGFIMVLFWQSGVIPDIGKFSPLDGF